MLGGSSCQAVDIVVVVGLSGSVLVVAWAILHCGVAAEDRPHYNCQRLQHNNSKPA